MLTTPEEVRTYLREKEWVSCESVLHIEALSGGVSNQVWKITGPSFRWVMKQALPKLRVQADWFSDVRRIERERAAMQALEPLLAEGEVPKVLFADEQSHTYVMMCAPEGAVTWKEQLMCGRFDAESAAQAGRLLGRLHRQTRERQEELKSRFVDQTFFKELRIDPFHRYLAARYPELSAPIGELIRRITTNPVCLVHGDYSPKNILVAPARQMILLDYEVAHWGNPLFDIAFCVAHLMLKGWALHLESKASGLIHAFLHTYGPDAGGLLPHLGLMLLARIDGKSPVDYLREERQKDMIRKTGKTWISAIYDEDKDAEHPFAAIQNVLEVGS